MYLSIRLSVHPETFQVGQTVEVLKSHLQAEYAISMASQQLYYEEKIMMDPLSLLDYIEIDKRGEEGGEGEEEPQQYHREEEEEKGMEIERESKTERAKKRKIPEEMYVVVEGEMEDACRK